MAPITPLTIRENGCPIDSAPTANGGCTGFESGYTPISSSPSAEPWTAPTWTPEEVPAWTDPSSNAPTWDAPNWNEPSSWSQSTEGGSVVGGPQMQPVPYHTGDPYSESIGQKSESDYKLAGVPVFLWVGALVIVVGTMCVGFFFLWRYLKRQDQAIKAASEPPSEVCSESGEDSPVEEDTEEAEAPPPVPPKDEPTAPEPAVVAKEKKPRFVWFKSRAPSVIEDAPEEEPVEEAKEEEEKAEETKSLKSLDGLPEMPKFPASLQGYGSHICTVGYNGPDSTPRLSTFEDVARSIRLENELIKL